MNTNSSTEKLPDSVKTIASVVDSEGQFSDILLTAEDPVMVRTVTGWEPFSGEIYSSADIDFVLAAIEPNWQNILMEGGFSRPYVVGDWRLRVTAYLANRGQRKMLSIRRTPIDPLSLDKTGLPPSVKTTMVSNPRGLILLSGATGSGKTTTMAAMVDHINETRSAHIVTIEDPIEYVFRQKNSVFSQREVGSDVPSFFEGVRAAMRQRPDVIVVGEIRDRDTAENAMLAGESGHLVIATVHATSAFGAVQKLVSFFPGDEQSRTATLATSLMGVIHQSIVPAVDNKSGVLAAEIMFNHHQNFSNFLGDVGKFSIELNEPKDGISRSMASSLADLVSNKKVTKAEALKSVAGQGLTSKQVKERLDLVKG